MKALIGGLWSALALAAAAHPGVGIVKDGRGNVFFTDTKSVWRIGPGERLSVAVPNVHTHELWLDVHDRLFGEHLWYEADGPGKWRHRVWCLDADGSLGEVKPPSEGFLTGYSFVRDREGTMYWTDRGKTTVIKKRLRDGTIVVHADAGFRSVGAMTATPDGVLYLMDAGDLRKVSPEGRTSTMAVRVSSQNPPPEAVRDLNYHLGLWTDPEGNVCVAVSGERTVLKVLADGSCRTVARSTEPWAPSGGRYDPDGTLWLLEYDTRNAARVRRILPDGNERAFEAKYPQ